MVLLLVIKCLFFRSRFICFFWISFNVFWKLCKVELMDYKVNFLKYVIDNRSIDIKKCGYFEG